MPYKRTDGFAGRPLNHKSRVDLFVFYAAARLIVFSSSSRRQLEQTLRST